MNIIIFSKDRACQLDLLLESFKNVHITANNKIVLYTFSSDDFKDGYSKVRQKYPEWQFKLQEGEIKNYLLESLTSELTMFLVDDNVFVNSFCIDSKVRMLKENKEILCVSLRLGKNISYDYMNDRKINVPEINFDGLFLWKGQEGCWGYPMSLDGHIFRTADILPIIKKINFKNPNELEWQLSCNPPDKKYMVCFLRPVLTNLAINKVQKWNNNRHGNAPVYFLNRQYLKGKKIDLEDIIEKEKDFNSTHEEIGIKLI